MEKKISENVVLVVNTLKEMADAATYNEVCEKLGRKVGSGVFTQAVKSGFLAAEDAEFDCNIVRADTGAVVGHTKKAVKIYTYVKDAA